MQRKTRFLLLLIVVSLVFVFQHWMGRPFFYRHLLTSVSSDGRYKLEVYSVHHWRFFAAPGDGGNRYAYAVLRNRWGWKIGGSDRACEPSDYDVYEVQDIEWDLAGGHVWFAPARGINLHDGRCEM